MFIEHQFRKGTILIINNNNDLCKTSESFLRSCGHEVDSAVNSESGLHKLDEKKFDIIIADLKLPGISKGIINKINSIQQKCYTIIATSTDTIDTALEFMKAGALDFVTYSLNNKHLDIVIQKALERKELIKAAEERDYFRKVSLTDELTGLYNRRYLLNAIERQIHHSSRNNTEFSFMMIDIDDFKSINDIYGHQTGDNVLCKISGCITDICRRYDILARYGGEEFSVLLPDTPIEDAGRAADRILQGIKSSCNVSDKIITVSIGISIFPVHAASCDDIIRKADTALYCSKQAGKNQYTIYNNENIMAVAE